MQNLICAVVLGVVATSTIFGEELRNGTFFPLEKAPAELIARAPAGTPVRFVLEENGTTGYQWEIDSNTNECDIVVEHRGAAENGLAGAPGKMSVVVTSKVQTPARVEFRYRRPWEKGVKPIKSVRFILYTASDKVASPLYKLAKEMGAKFSFGTNNFDPRPKDLSRWLEAIAWLDLKAFDIWTPIDLKR